MYTYTHGDPRGPLKLTCLPSSCELSISKSALPLANTVPRALVKTSQTGL